MKEAIRVLPGEIQMTDPVLIAIDQLTSDAVPERVAEIQDLWQRYSPHFIITADKPTFSMEQEKGSGVFSLTGAPCFRQKIRMPRRPRLAARDLAYLVLNRRVGRLPLFDKSKVRQSPFVFTISHTPFAPLPLALLRYDCIPQ